MKIYISADIEGITGVSHWDETIKERPGYLESARQMSAEVKAACEAANDAGATEIWVKDAHETARNIDFSILPENVKMVRGWSDDPICMLQELDTSFDACILIGHHAPSGSSGSPLSHTYSNENSSIKINGVLASEFLIINWTAAFMNVPVVFVSGDKAICEEAKTFNPSIFTLAVKEGIGNSIISIHPGMAVKRTRDFCFKALSGNKEFKIMLPDNFLVEISYKNHGKAYKMGFYPGMKKINANTLSYETKDFYEVLRMLLFTAL